MVSVWPIAVHRLGPGTAEDLGQRCCPAPRSCPRSGARRQSCAARSPAPARSPSSETKTDAIAARSPGHAVGAPGPTISVIASASASLTRIGIALSPKPGISATTGPTRRKTSPSASPVLRQRLDQPGEVSGPCRDRPDQRRARLDPDLLERQHRVGDRPRLEQGAQEPPPPHRGDERRITPRRRRIRHRLRHRLGQPVEHVRVAAPRPAPSPSSPIW